MRKVTLVIDEVREMIGLEKFLRRLGFDVLSLGKDMFVNDAVLSFHPDVVIASYRGKHVDGLKLSLRLKKLVPPPRVALAYTGATPVIPEESKKSIEAMLELPADPSSAIRMMAQLTGLAAQPFLDKYEKLSTAVLTQEEQKVLITDQKSLITDQAARTRAAGSASPVAASAAPADAWDPVATPGKAATARSERSNRYDRYLQDHPEEKPNRVLPHDKAAKAMAKLKKDSEPEKDELERIEAEKLAFAKALFIEGNEKKKQ